MTRNPFEDQVLFEDGGGALNMPSSVCWRGGFGPDEEDGDEEEFVWSAIKGLYLDIREVAYSLRSSTCHRGAHTNMS